MITEIATTTGRHEIISPITGHVVTKSFFGTTVEDPLNVSAHMETVKAHLDDVPLDETIVVYVTGLSTLLQAVFAVWIGRNCYPPMMSLDLHPGKLVFAHYDRDAETYVFKDALTGNVSRLIQSLLTNRNEHTEP